MRVGYRIIQKGVRFYIRKGDGWTVYTCLVFGRKRIKPERIWKYRYRDFSSYTISFSRFEEIMEWGIDWFEVDENKNKE